MPFQNFNDRHFIDQEKIALEDLVTQLETGFASKLANLTAEERKQFGSVNEQNKLVIIKVKHLADHQIDLRCPDVDWQKFDADYTSREFLEAILGRLERLTYDMTSAKILHDYDNYQNALRDYEYSKYKNNLEAPGFATKVRELRQFFKGGALRRSNMSVEENDSENTVEVQ